MRVLMRRLSRRAFGVAYYRVNSKRASCSFDDPRFGNSSTAVTPYDCADSL